MTSGMPLRDAFERDGRVWLRGAISEDDLQHFDQAATRHSKAGQRVETSPPLAAVLRRNGSLMTAIAKIDPEAHPVRVVAFNKSGSTNWGVPWHQDRVIAVAGRHDIEGYKNWTQKAGVWHCEPPQELLEQMLFVRVHLDQTDQQNGAMDIAVGSHAKGVLSVKNAEAVAQQYPIESCEAARGDVLILKMLTLHRSKPSKVTSDRRAFRIDFSAAGLPKPLSWT